MAEIIRIPDGNAFLLRVTGQIRTGDYTEDADFSVVTHMGVNFVRRGRIAQTFGLDSLGRIVIENSGNLAQGVYGVELYGYYHGEPWRNYQKNVFQIVNENANSDPGSDNENELTYDVTFDVTFGGDGISAAFVDATVATHNSNQESHPDLREEIDGKVSDVKVGNTSIVEGGVAVIDLSGKQDVIQDLATIRSGAAAGGTAYQKPGTGIPASDLSAEVQDMIENGGKTKSVSVNGGTPVTPDANGLVDLTIEQANVTIGNVTTGAAGSNAEVHNSGTGTAPVLDFVIPKGDTGDTGPQGPQGDSAIWTGEGEPWSGMKNTTGQSTTEPMTQKAVTDEFDKFKEEPYDMASVTWVGGGITTTGYDNNEGPIRLNRRSNEISFDVSTYDKVRVTAPNNKVRFAVYSIEGTGENRTFGIVSNGYINGPDEFYFTPESNKVYVIRVAGPNSTQAEIESLVASDYPVITLYNKSSTHIIDDVKDRLEDIEHGVKKNTTVPSYFFGEISSSGYDLTNYGNKVTRELEFDPDVISSITIHRRGNEVRFALYTITGDVITTPTGYVTDDYTFTPISGVKYVIRIVSAVTGTQTRAKMEAVPVSSYPELVINYANTSGCIGNIEGQLRQIGEKYYGYSRNYSNITPLLTFEHKSISTDGIVNNQSTLLAKIPSIGCVEVKMNKPVGGFSVWKKSGNTITCLQEYTHYQYRYTGDYSSEYYVMLQAESGDTLETAIAAVYTYSDEGVTINYTAPSWAKGKKLAFFGDSIVQGRYPKNGSQSVNICMDKPWPNLVAEALCSEDFKNFAIGGALVYNNDWRSMQRNADLILGYDVVFVCGGTNDYGNKTSKANFEAAYADMLDTLIANNTKVIVMTPVHRTKAVSSPAMSFINYAISIMDVAASKNVPVVDTIKLTDTPEFDQHLVDGLHPDEIGQRMIADTLLEAIKYID